MLGDRGTYVVVDCCYQHRANHEKPIDEWDVELAMECLGGMHDLYLGEVRELHNLC